MSCVAPEFFFPHDTNIDFNEWCIVCQDEHKHEGTPACADSERDCTPLLEVVKNGQKKQDTGQRSHSATQPGSQPKARTSLPSARPPPENHPQQLISHELPSSRKAGRGMDDVIKAVEEVLIEEEKMGKLRSSTSVGRLMDRATQKLCGFPKGQSRCREKSGSGCRLYKEDKLSNVGENFNSHPPPLSLALEQKVDEKLCSVLLPLTTAVESLNVKISEFQGKQEQKSREETKANYAKASKNKEIPTQYDEDLKDVIPQAEIEWERYQDSKPVTMGTLKSTLRTELKSTLRTELDDWGDRKINEITPAFAPSVAKGITLALRAIASTNDQEETNILQDSIQYYNTSRTRSSKPNSKDEANMRLLKCIDELAEDSHARGSRNKTKKNYRNHRY